MRKQFSRFSLYLIPGLVCGLVWSAFNFVSDAPPKKAKRITVAFYNVENLFDIEDHPHKNDNQFLPEGDYKWTQEHYEIKLNNLAKVISQIGDEDGPEILGLCEVENKKVIEDLIGTGELASRNYGIVHFESPDQRGIDNALIYKKDVFTPLYSQPYRVNFPNPDMTTRDILMVKGIIGKTNEVNIFVNHWSSRRGGRNETAYKRDSCARVLRRTLDSIQTLNPDAPVIIMGDFNDEPKDNSLMRVLHAAKDTQQAKATLLYNPMYQLKEDGQGSHKYKNYWDMLDQVILSRPLLDPKSDFRYVYNSASIYKPDWMCQEDAGVWTGAPRRSHIRRQFYPDGYSDHFPVYVHLEYYK